MRAIPPIARVALIVGASVSTGCATGDSRTLAALHHVRADTTDLAVENGLDEAMQGYRRFLAEAPTSGLTPEAMRRLADLKLEREYGILGGAASRQAAPSEPAAAAAGRPEAGPRPASLPPAPPSEVAALGANADPTELVLPDGRVVDTSGEGPLAAIALYDHILESYPSYPHNDRVLYQKARAYDELGRFDEALDVTERLIAEYPHSRHVDEVRFRRAEYFFARRRYLEAEQAYAAITARGAASEFYELALYKLGWSYYKQELHDEAIRSYVDLLDHKVATGYDFDQSDDQDASRRIADTFRVLSLSFSSLGGPDAVVAFFAGAGTRVYEDRVFARLGDFYLEKLRYQDAADAFEAFVALHPHHRSAPRFGMRVVEIYEAGDFPKLVLEAKKDFAARYALDAEYWSHFPVEEAPAVVAYLESNLRDLASHYHAAYQDPELADDAEANFAEARRWYRGFLDSFPAVAGAPGIHRRLADLLLEHEDFTAAALAYEHTAYGYAAHDEAAEAGYAAIFAHRERQQRASDEAREAARADAVASTLRFVATFPAHENAAVVLGAAVDDLYEMGRHALAIEHGRALLAGYPEADPAIVRSAWLAIAHSAFALEDYAQAETAYARVLDATAPDAEDRQAVADNLAAAIYRQAELASETGDHRGAADHYLRIADSAPDSEIRPNAEFDAGAALMRLEAWGEAVSVLEAFRDAHPDHELRDEATRQLASIHREQGAPERAAAEYERVAEDDEALRGEALLVAAELYEEAGQPQRSIDVYRRYLDQHSGPLEDAIEARSKLAGLHDGLDDGEARDAQLRWIVDAQRSAGAETTDRTRYLAARAALTLAEAHHARFVAARLALPFESSLAEKRRLMDVSLAAFRRLLEYEVAEVTAGATYYMAETYRDFSEALLDSERPRELSETERVEYEIVLEEEAYPFEEQAIAVHEKNLELMSAGVYNRWIERSLGQLGELVPGRYAKVEESSGLIASVDRYAYTPPAPQPAELPADGEPAPLDPAPPSAPEPTSPEPVPAAQEVSA